MKLLSILIPTYNRALYLEQELISLLPQIKKFETSIEIIISDNASSDNTHQVIDKVLGRWKLTNCIYSCNEENVGAENNIYNLINSSRGKYLLILGDDDILAPNFIETIMDLIKCETEYSIVHWNRLYGDANCSNCLLMDVNYDQLLLVDDLGIFLNRVLEKPNFISSVIINRKCWELGGQYVKDIDYLGYQWFARMLWGAYCYNRECAYLFFPLVIQRNPIKEWARLFPQYHLCSMSNIFFDLDKVFPGLYGKWIKKIRIESSTVLPIVSQSRSYYRQPEIRKMMIKHLSAKERILFYYYLIPGSYYIYKVKCKLFNQLIRLLNYINDAI